jgi:hypothetical protein
LAIDVVRASAKDVTTNKNYKLLRGAVQALREREQNAFFLRTLHTDEIIPAVKDYKIAKGKSKRCTRALSQPGKIGNYGRIQEVATELSEE